MKKYLKFFFALILLLVILVPNKIYAMSSYENYRMPTYSDYTIESYDVDMVVNENNTFDITETIVADFKTQRHGIIRRIPLKNNIIRNDGTQSSNRARISKISVNCVYTTSKNNGYEEIKIGSSGRTVIGKQEYIIKYTYSIGKDPLKGADELYFNLIGYEWDTSINNVSFRITMPKQFDKSLLGFSSGYRGWIDSSNVSYSVDGNIINGSLLNKLNAGQALTVRLSLPEGYFVGTKLNIDIFSVAVIMISVVCVLIADRLWSKYGKDDEVVETVEFYPPDNYNSAEIGFLYNGTADDKSVISLLIYLANKGYLKIEEEEDEGHRLFEVNKNFRITKIKEYDGENEIERLFFNGLFKDSIYSDLFDVNKAKEIMEEIKENRDKGSFLDAFNKVKNSKETQTKDSVTAIDLYDNFYTTLNNIKSKLESKENKNKIFETSASEKTKWIVVMIVIIYLLITVKPIIEYGETVMLLPIALLFPAIGFPIMMLIFSNETTETIYVNGKPKNSRASEIAGGLLFGMIFILMPIVGMVMPALIENPMYLLMFIIGIICIIVLTIFIKIMPKRTKFGNKILGRIRGFRRFLETAEKPQLESLVAQNPEYFYNILPYTYALGVSDTWIKQFETIAIQAPNWYNSRNGFNINTFGTFMTNTMTTASSVMSSSPSSSSGGGSHGGGSSGGGSGGGGGSSW